MTLCPAMSPPFRISRVQALIASVSQALKPIVFAPIFVGCSWNLFERVPVQEVVFVDQEVTCVQTIDSDLEGYFDGRDIDPSGIAACARSSLIRFSEKTKGRSAEEWTQGEVATFLSTLVGDTETNGPSETSRKITRELFFWKAVLVGGTDARLTRAELERLVKLLDRVQIPLRQLRGLGQALLLKAQPDSGILGSAKARELRAGLNGLADELAVVLEETHSRLTQGTQAARELGSAVNWSVFQNSSYLSNSQLFNTEAKLALAQSLKVFLVSGPKREIEVEEWAPLTRAVLRLWGDMLTFYYTIAHEHRILLSESDLVSETLNSLARCLEQAVAAHGTHIPVRVIEELIDALDANHLMPMGIRAQSAKHTLKAVLGKLLYGKAQPDYLTRENQLGRVQVQAIRDMIANWRVGQKMINAMFESSPDLKESVATVRLRASALASQSSPSTEEKVRSQLQRLIETGRPLVRDDQDRLIILPPAKVEEISHSDLSRLNLLRVLFDRGLNGYTRDPNRLLPWPSISSEETQEIFLDVRDVGRDLGIVDIRSLTAGERTFMESNVFLSVSDGDQWLSLSEAIEWFETVASAGVTADLLHQDLLDRGCEHSDRDVFGRERLEIQCVRRNMPALLEHRLAHLPIVSRTVREFVQAGRSDELMNAIENAARPLGADQGPTDSSELRALSPILHYLESLFSLYDIDENFRLDPPEVWSVYPLIRPFIEQMANNVLAAGRSTMQRSDQPKVAVVSELWDHPDLPLEYRGIFPPAPNLLPEPSPTKITELQQAALFSILVREGKLPEFSNEGSNGLVRWFKDISSKLRVFTRSMQIGAIRKSRDWLKFSESADTKRILDILGSFQSVGRATKNAKLQAKIERGVEEWLREVNFWSQSSREESLVLLQCSDAASTLLRGRLQNELSVLLARQRSMPTEMAELSQHYEARAAAAQLKTVVQLDPALRLLCMPF